MANRFDLVPKHKLKLTNIVVLALKLGQKELKPAVSLRCKVRGPSTLLDKFSTRWRSFLYQKNSVPAKQQSVEGVSAPMELTPEAVALGSFDLSYEQTGCTFIVHLGVSSITLKDATVKKVKVVPHESEAVDIEFSVYSSDLSEETMGALAVLKQHEVDAELTLPEPLQQEVEEQGKKIEPVTPLGALKRGTRSEQHATVQ